MLDNDEPIRNQAWIHQDAIPLRSLRVADGTKVVWFDKFGMTKADGELLKQLWATWSLYCAGRCGAMSGTQIYHILVPVERNVWCVHERHLGYDSQLKSSKTPTWELTIRINTAVSWNKMQYRKKQKGQQKSRGIILSRNVVLGLGLGLGVGGRCCARCVMMVRCMDERYGYLRWLAAI